MVAAYSARSRAYAQAMRNTGLAPEHVILFGDPTRDQDADFPANIVTIDGLFLPDMTEPLASTCADAGWNVTQIEPQDINSEDVADELEKTGAKLVIYSGYSGQIVGSDLLSRDFDMLHMHAGWLPDFRGSTTIYYSWLMEGRCGVSALLLDTGIDTGPLVRRRHYPIPPPEINVDLLYDSALRADVLVDVLKDYAETGTLKPAADDGEDRTYYVIHPVLKHLALLSREDAAEKS
jgi:methionyl-tRNA formyltransferase